jgi:hypothetical protein
MLRPTPVRGILAWPLLLAMTACPLAVFSRPASARALNTRSPRIHRTARTSGTVVPLEDLHHSELAIRASDAGASADRSELFIACADAAPLPKFEQCGQPALLALGKPPVFELYVFHERGPPNLAVTPQPTR